MIGHRTEIAAQQVQDPKREQGLQFTLQQSLLIRKFSHALLKLDPIAQELRGGFITALLLLSLRCRSAGQRGDQGEIRLTATTKRGGLRRLQPLACELERLLSCPGFPEQDQASHFIAGRKIQTDGFVGMGFTQCKQGCFVLSPCCCIRQQISRSAQQGFPLNDHLMGEPLIGRTVATALKTSKNRVSLSRRTDAQKSEVIDGQIHRRVPNRGGL